MSAVTVEPADRLGQDVSNLEMKTGVEEVHTEQHQQPRLAQPKETALHVVLDDNPPGRASQPVASSSADPPTEHPTPTAQTSTFEDAVRGSRSRVKIPITTSRESLLKAAELLSQRLCKLGLDHAYIGGFAWSLLGSDRPTAISYHPSLNVFCLIFLLLYDIDVMIKFDPKLIPDMRDHLSKMDPHFVFTGVKLYFSQVRKMHWT
jgi:hypothetical protein